MTKIVCISDTHNRLDDMDIPSGDILIHAGDHTSRGNFSELSKAAYRLGKLKHKFKAIVVVAGNHDRYCEQDPIGAKRIFNEHGITYLHDEMVVVEGLKIYGSPYQPEFHNWAFNLPRGEALKAKWDLIPEELDVLITHGPPMGYGDLLDEMGSAPGTRVGCEDLLRAVEKVKPKLHVFGHIHCGHGIYENEHTMFVNASSCTEHYEPTNDPITIHTTA